MAIVLSQSRPAIDGSVDSLESIVLSANERPAIPVRDGTFADPPSGWEWLSNSRKEIDRAISCIGRVELEGHTHLNWVGVGVRVGIRRFLIARHAAQLFCKGLGDSGLVMEENVKVFLATGPEYGNARTSRIPVARVLFIHPFFDVALCELEDVENDQAESGLLASAIPSELTTRKVAVIGFAAIDPRNDPVLVEAIYGKMGTTLYVQPGQIRGVDDTNFSFGVRVPAIKHDCTTVGGAAGAPLVDLETGLFLGIHYGGIFLTENLAVPAWELSRDARVRKHGVEFENPAWLSLWAGVAPEETEAAAKRDHDESPWAHYFDQDELYQIHNLLVRAGFANNDRAERLLTVMDPEFRGQLPGDRLPPSERILAWLDIINQIAALQDGSVPMRVFLNNAVRGSRPRVESAELDKFLKRVQIR